MKPVNLMTDGELAYAASDIRTTIAVGAQGWGVETLKKYLGQLHDVEREQQTRASKRYWRGAARQYRPIDPLGVPIKSRNRVRFRSPYEIGQYFVAIWRLANL